MQYLHTLYVVHLPFYALLAVLAIAMQVLVGHKYVAFFLMIVYYVATIAMPVAGFEHPMVLYAWTPAMRYSDMNGYGHYLVREHWYHLYWAGAALMLAVATRVFW